jgi:transcriptional regulator with XRE-family HTH domain
MIQESITYTARTIVGQHLAQVREEKNLTYYALSKLSGLSIAQIQTIENGTKAYTFDSFLKIIHALDLYFFLKDKDGKHLDFIDMAEKAKNDK